MSHQIKQLKVTLLESLIPGLYNFELSSMKIEKSRKKFDIVYWLLCTRSQLRLSQRGNETRESAIFHITSWFVLFSCRCFCLEDFPIRKFYDFETSSFSNLVCFLHYFQKKCLWSSTDEQFMKNIAQINPLVN